MGPVLAARLAGQPLPEVGDNPPIWPLRMVDVDRQRIAVRRPRERQSGEPAVYVHGLGGSATNWTDVGALLADILDGEAIDLPGFGESDPALGRDYRLSTHADVLARYVEQRGVGPVHLVGNSLGGAVSLVLAARRPELVRSLTLISPAMPDLRPHGRMRMLLGASALPGMTRVVGKRMAADPDARMRLVIETVFGDPTVVPPERLQQAIAEAARHAALPWAMEAFTASLRSLLLSHAATGERSLWAQAQKVLVPALVIWGDLDRLVSVSLSLRTARALEDARLLVLPGVGHTAHLEAPQVVARAVLGLVEDCRTSAPSGA